MNSSITRTKLQKFRPYLFDIFLFLAFLIIITSINSDWIFSRGGRDGWMYLGYFKHYDTAQFLESNKKIARLPWILTGYYTHRIFSDFLSVYILRLGVIFLTSIILYTLFVRLSNQLTAFLLTLGYITYQPALGSGGWDYHNGFSGLLFVTSYYLILSSVSHPSSKKRFFITGLFVALTIHTNILYSFIFFPIFAIKLYDLSRTFPLRSLIYIVISPALIGGIFITILLGTINFYHGRQFFFFTILAARSSQLLSHPNLELSWWKSWSSLWWLRSEQVVIWEIIFILIGLWIIQNFIKGKSFNLTQDISLKNQILLEFSLSFFLFFIFQSIGHPVLQPYYMAYPLYLPSFLALSVLLDHFIRTTNEEYHVILPFPTLIRLTFFIIFLTIFTLLMTGILTFNIWNINKTFGKWQTGFTLSIDLVLCLLIIFISRITGPTKKQESLRLLSLYFLILLFLAFNNSRFPAYSYSHLECNSAQEMYKLINKIDSKFFPFFKSGKNIKIIFNDHERMMWTNGCTIGVANLGNALDAMGYNGEILLSGEFEKDQEIIKPILQKEDPKKDIFIIISKDQNVFKEIKSITSSQNKKASIYKIYHFNSLGKEIISLNIFTIK